MRAALESGSALRVDGQPLRAEVLREFYASIAFEPVWGTDPGGVARSTLALDALRGARDHGLVPAHYGLAALRRRAEPASLAMAVQRELLLTDSLLRYAVDVRAGRLRPAAAQPDWGIAPPDREDPVRELAEAVEAGTLGSWLEALPPPHAGYARLVTALRALHAAADRAGRTAADPRIRQVAVNLERWRWLPRRLESRHLVVNAADATLAVVEDGRVRLASRVVVGDELHPTPVVRSELGAIVFNPPWTVPTSIVVDEFLPKLRANPRFLADNDIVILDRREDPHGLAVDWTAVPRSGSRSGCSSGPAAGTRWAGCASRRRTASTSTSTTRRCRSSSSAPTGRSATAACAWSGPASWPPSCWPASRPAGPRPSTRAMAPGATSVVTVARPLPVYLLYWTAFVDDEGRLQLGTTRTTATRAWPPRWPAPRSSPRVPTAPAGPPAPARPREPLRR